MYERDQPLAANYNFTIEKGNEVMEGHYCKQSKRKETSFMMDACKSPTYIYSHLICASKFVMVQAAHKQKGGIIVYNLSSA